MKPRSNHRRTNAWIAAAALTTLLLAAGCSKQPTTTPKGSPASQPASKPAAASKDPLAGAPADPAALLAWAEKELEKTPVPVPLPTKVALASPKHPTIRLDDMLDMAAIRSDWKPSDKPAAALAAVGPLRSDQPGPNFGQQRVLDPEEGEANRLVMRGFSVKREDVGAIALEAKIPFGTYFDLWWTRGGSLRIPIEKNTEFFSINIATDGFNEWSGPLDSIAIVTDGAGQQPVEIRSLKFLPHADAFPSAVGTRRVKLARELRSTIYAHASSDVTFKDIPIPPSAKLSLGLGLVGGAEGKATGSIEVVAETDGQKQTVLAVKVEKPDAWHDHTVSLEALAGKKASITLRTLTADASVVTIWSNPVVYEPTPEAPIVGIYLVDTLSAKHLGLYGYSRTTDPNLKSFAEQGVWFGNMHANAPATVMSVPNLLFGLSTERHQVYHSSAIAPQQLVSIADALRAAGFATASFVTNTNAGPRQGMDQGFDFLIDRMAFHWSGNVDRTVPLDEVRTFLQSHADRPVFFYIHTAEPHGPYEPLPGFAGKFATGYNGPLKGTYDRRTGFFAAKSPEEIAHIVSLYDEEVLYADHRFGLFLKMTDEIGVRARLNLFFTADHGEEFMEHGNWNHSKTLYNEVLRIPLVAAGPMITQRGRADATACLVDLMPTILDLLELPEPYLMSGRSLAAGLRTGPDKLVDLPTFATSYAFIRGGMLHWTMTEGASWKLMFGPQREPPSAGGAPTRFALFDLANDPQESRSVLAGNPAVARRMIGALLAHQRRQHAYDAGVDANSLKYDAEQLRELRSLGYIGD